MITVAVLGARGRMGATVCQAVTDAKDMQLVARLDKDDTLDAKALAGAQVAVDFTTPQATLRNSLLCVEAGVAPVIGTTGWDEDALSRLATACRASGTPALVAPNFALSAVLVMALAAKAAPYFESVEVIEAHHPDKLDAPSGTAAATAAAIAQARREANRAVSPDATESDPLGARGGKVDGVAVHSVRLRGLTAHEKVLLGNAGEMMTLATDCFDRVSFMPGVLLAVRRVRGLAGLVVGLDKVMDLG